LIQKKRKEKIRELVQLRLEENSKLGAEENYDPKLKKQNKT